MKYFEPPEELPHQDLTACVTCEQIDLHMSLVGAASKAARSGQPLVGLHLLLSARKAAEDDQTMGVNTRGFVLLMDEAIERYRTYYMPTLEEK